MLAMTVLLRKSGMREGPLGGPMRWREFYPPWAAPLPEWEERSQAVVARAFYPSIQEAEVYNVSSGTLRVTKKKTKPCLGEVE